MLYEAVLSSAATVLSAFACDHAAGGFAIGFALGFITKWLLSLLRSRGAKAPEEMALTLAMAYLAFYLANAPGTSHTPPPPSLPPYPCNPPAPQATTVPVKGKKSADFCMLASMLQSLHLAS